MKKLYSAIKYLLLLSVAALLLWVSFRGVHWDDFIAGLKSANYYWIGTSMMVSVGAFWFRAQRWRLIMLPLGVKIRRRDAWDGINIGYITNFAIPRAGELARCGVITKKTGLPFETVAGTVVLERSVDLVSLIVVTFSVLFFQWEKFGSFINREIINSLGERLSFNLLWIVVAILFAGGVFIYIIYHFRKKNPLFRKIAKIAKGVINGVISGFKMPQKWMFLAYTLLIWVCYW
ncbi:MAG: lysylphosphatidylglycerol synthase transmembrane domain-containing protein, partial [Bacteroidales bacterium]